MTIPSLIFIPTRNFLPSERQLVFRSIRKSLVKTNLHAIILPSGEKCGLNSKMIKQRRFFNYIILIWIALSLASAATADEMSTTVSPATYKQLQNVDELVADLSYGKALAILSAMLPKSEANSYEKAVVLRAMASVYSLQGQYNKAATVLEKCVATKSLPTHFSSTGNT